MVLCSFLLQVFSCHVVNTRVKGIFQSFCGTDSYVQQPDLSFPTAQPTRLALPPQTTSVATHYQPASSLHLPAFDPSVPPCAGTSLPPPEVLRTNTHTLRCTEVYLNSICQLGGEGGTPKKYNAPAGYSPLSNQL